LAKLILDELAKAQAGEYPSLDVTANTPDDVLDAFLFGDDERLSQWRAEGGCMGSPLPLEALLATL
jgi:hypothetical protein